MTPVELETTGSNNCDALMVTLLAIAAPAAVLASANASVGELPKIYLCLKMSVLDSYDAAAVVAYRKGGHPSPSAGTKDLCEGHRQQWWGR